MHGIINPENAQLCASEEFFNKMSLRRSIRAFSEDPVDRRVLINAIKTANTAPSGANRQPWFFALIESKEIKSEIREAAEKVEQEFYNHKASATWLNDLKPIGTNAHKPYLSQAPALIAVFSRTESQEAKSMHPRTYYPLESTGIAVGFLITALHNSGLATLTHTPKPMFFLNQILDLDKSYRPYLIVVTGFAQKTSLLPSLVRKSYSEVFRSY